MILGLELLDHGGIGKLDKNALLGPKGACFPYPLSLTRTGQAPISGPVYHLYEYDGCRIQRRVPYGEGNLLYATSIAQFTYDDAGRIVAITSDMNAQTYDYACW